MQNFKVIRWVVAVTVVLNLALQNLHNIFPCQSDALAWRLHDLGAYLRPLLFLAVLKSIPLADSTTQRLIWLMLIDQAKEVIELLVNNNHSSPLSDVCLYLLCFVVIVLIPVYERIRLRRFLKKG